jgi:hypothetical protein
MGVSQTEKVGALMALSFTVIESTMTPLWDFGWFDLSRFKIDGLPDEPPAGVDVLREFLRDAISQRSFCTSPDPWGNTGGLHGPFPMEILEAEWYGSMSPEDLPQRVATILNDADFSAYLSRNGWMPPESEVTMCSSLRRPTVLACE